MAWGAPRWMVQQREQDERGRYPELALAPLDVVAAVDRLRASEGRPKSTFGQAADATAANVMPAFGAGYYDQPRGPRAVGDASNSTPFFDRTTAGYRNRPVTAQPDPAAEALRTGSGRGLLAEAAKAAGGSIEGFYKLNQPALTVAAGGLGAPGIIGGTVLEGLTHGPLSQPAVTDHGAIAEELTRPLNYLGAGGGTTGLLKAAGAGVLSRFGYEAADATIPDSTPKPLRLGLTSAAALLAGAGGYSAVGGAQKGARAVDRFLGDAPVRDVASTSRPLAASIVPGLGPGSLDDQFAALQAKVAREGRTPENTAAVSDLFQRMLVKAGAESEATATRAGREAQQQTAADIGHRPPALTGQDIDNTLKRARSIESPLETAQTPASVPAETGNPLSRAEEMQRVREQYRAQQGGGAAQTAGRRVRQQAEFDRATELDDLRARIAAVQGAGPSEELGRLLLAEEQLVAGKVPLKTRPETNAVAETARVVESLRSQREALIARGDYRGNAARVIDRRLAEAERAATTPADIPPGQVSPESDPFARFDYQNQGNPPQNVIPPEKMAELRARGGKVGRGELPPGAPLPKPPGTTLGGGIIPGVGPDTLGGLFGKKQSEITELDPALIKFRPDIFQQRDVPAGKPFDPKRVQQLAERWDPALLDPPAVVHDTSTGDYVVYAGNHRVGAAQVRGEPRIPVRVREADLSDPAQRAGIESQAALSNFLTRQQNVREQYRGLKAAVDRGADVETLAGDIGMSPGRVQQVLDVGGAGPQVLERATSNAQYVPIAAEVGRAVRIYGMDPETAAGLFTRLTAGGAGKSLPSASAVRDTMDTFGRRVLQMQQEQGGFDFGRLEGTETSPLLAALTERTKLRSALEDEQRAIADEISKVGRAGQRLQEDPEVASLVEQLSSRLSARGQQTQARIDSLDDQVLGRMRARAAASPPAAAKPAKAANPEAAAQQGFEGMPPPPPAPPAHDYEPGAAPKRSPSLADRLLKAAQNPLTVANQTMRAANTAFDVAFFGRIGPTAGMLHPLDTGKAYATALRSLAQPKALERQWAARDAQAADIAQRYPGAPTFTVAEMRDGAPKLTVGKEASSDVQPGALGKVPGVRRLAGIMRVALDDLRPRMFLTEVENRLASGKVTPEQLHDPAVQRDIGRGVNLVTGQSSVKLGPEVGNIVEFPNWLAAQHEMIIRAGTSRTITGEMARRSLRNLAGIATAVTVAANLAQGRDPLSLRNGVPQAHIGDKTIDVFGPLGELISKEAGIGRRTYEDGPAGAASGVGDFYRGVASPVYGTAVDQLTGTDVLGRPARGLVPLAERALPFNALSALKGEGEPVTQAMRSVGLRIHEPSTYAARDLALQRDPTYGKPYGDLEPRQQRDVRLDPKYAEFNTQLKDAQEERAAGGSAYDQRAVARDRITQNRLAQEHALAADIASGKTTGQRIRDVYNGIQHDAAQQAAGVDRALPPGERPKPGDPNEQALQDYYSALGDSHTPTGGVDYDRVDARLAELQKGWTAAQQKYVADNTGLAEHDPALKPFIDTKQALTKAGFFDRDETVWASLQKAAPANLAFIKDYASYYEWRDAAEASLRQKWAASGGDPRLADKAVQQAMGQAPAVKAVEDAMTASRQKFERAFMQRDPQLAASAFQYGYLHLDQAEFNYLRQAAGR